MMLYSKTLVLILRWDMGKRSVGPSTVWLPIFFKKYSFVFSRRNNFLHVWNNL